MKNYVGRKIRGFRFEYGTDGVKWNTNKKLYIGEIGEITYQDSRRARIKFSDDRFDYPISLIEPHLIEEETPEIPQLGEGVLMEVSDDGIHWGSYNIIARLADGRFIDSEGNIWKHARPIPQLPKYTHAELVEIVGHEFEIIK
jgi:hypothetical protein